MRLKYKPIVRLPLQLDGEQWKLVPNYPGYEVSNLGRIKSSQQLKQRIRKPSVDKKKYCRIMLVRTDGKHMTLYLHRLVALEWVANPDAKPDVDHIDGNPSNNAAANLRWVTHKENINHAMQRHGNWLKGASRKSVMRALIATNSDTGEKHRFDSGRAAALWVGNPNAAGNISKACDQCRIAYGFYWAKA